MLESILQIKCMVLVYTILQMGIDTKVLGMKEEDKVLVRIRSEMETLNQATGKMGFLEFQLLRMYFFQNLLLQFLMPEFLKQSRYFKFHAELYSLLYAHIAKGYFEKW